MKETVRVMAEYQSYPTWREARDGIVNIDPQSLGLSEALVTGLLAWSDEFDETLNPADPGSSGFTEAQDERSFYMRGHRLAVALKNEMGRDVRVFYFDATAPALVEVEPA